MLELEMYNSVECLYFQGRRINFNYLGSLILMHLWRHSAVETVGGISPTYPGVSSAG